jgi:hypothetical protein
MTSETYVEERDERPASGGRTAWIAGAAVLLLLLAVGGFGWSAHRRAGTAEQALAAAASERDAAIATATQSQQSAAQAEAQAQAQAQALESQRLELERQLQAANGEITRLQAELAARAAAPAATVQTSELTPGTTPVEPAAGGLGTSAGTAPAANEAPAVVAAAAPEPPPAPEPLTITFDVNSSYFPGDLSGSLKRLADRLQPGQAYEVELTGAVGSDAASQDENARYNRWLAERRMSRVAEFLQKNAETERLEIKQAFAANDPSRRVVVEVRPLPQ